MQSVSNNQFDALVIGGGPAGLSAAIYLARARRSVVVVDQGRPGRSDWAQHNYNYFGFPDGISIVDLGIRGRQQAERFGAHFVDAEVTALSRDAAGFTARAGDRALRSRGVILATGVTDRWVTFPGYEEYIGRGMHTCVICDGYEMAGQRLVVAGNDDHAAQVARQCLNYAPASVTLVTNSEESGLTAAAEQALAAQGIAVMVDRIVGARSRVPGWFSALELRNGATLELDHLFSVQGADPNSAMARGLGVLTTPDGYIESDTEGRTNVEGVLAAGDVTRLFSHLVLTAAHEGATAATSLSHDLYAADQAAATRPTSQGARG